MSWRLLWLLLNTGRSYKRIWFCTMYNISVVYYRFCLYVRFISDITILLNWYLFNLLLDTMHIHIRWCVSFFLNRGFISSNQMVGGTMEWDNRGGIWLKLSNCILQHYFLNICSARMLMTICLLDINFHTLQKFPIWGLKGSDIHFIWLRCLIEIWESGRIVFCNTCLVHGIFLPKWYFLFPVIRFWLLLLLQIGYRGWLSETMIS